MILPLTFLRRNTTALQRACILTLLGAAGALHAQTTLPYSDQADDPNAYSTTGNPLTLLVATGSATQSGAISGTGSLTKSGAGTLLLSAANTAFTGGTRLSAGTLTAGTGSALGNTGAITFAGGTLRYGTGVSSDYAARIQNSTTAIAIDTNGNDVSFSQLDYTNTGGLTKSGAGTLILSDSYNFFEGATRLNGGMLRVSSAYALGFNLDALIFSGGTLQYATGSSGDYSSRIKNSAGAIAIDTNGNDVTFSNSLENSNTGGLIKSGAGTLTLSATSAYTGATRLNGGTLRLSNASVNSGTDDILFAGGTLQLTNSGSFSYGSRIKNSTGAIAIDTNGNDVALGGIGGSNTGGLVKSGAGTLTLDANTYTGTTRLNGGILRVTSRNSLGDSLAAGDITFAGGVLQFATTDLYTYPTRIKNSTAAIAIDTNGNEVTFSSSLDSSNTGGLTKSGAGTLILASSNAYTGTTLLTAGTLRLSALSALGSGSDAVSFAGGTLQYGTASSFDYSGRIQNSTAAIAIDANGYDVTFSGSLAASNTGGLTKSGTGALILLGSSNYTGITRLTAGSLRLASSSALNSGSGDISFAGGTLQFGITGSSNYAGRIKNNTGAIAIDTNGHDVTFSNSLDSSNTGGLTKSGTGTLILASSNSYTGTTRLTAGALRVTSDSSLGAGSGDIIFAGGTLQFGAGGSYGYASRIKNNTGAIAIDTNGYDVTLAYLDYTNTGGLTKSGDGTLILSESSNLFEGATRLNGGTLRVSSDFALGMIADTITFAGGTLQFGAGGSYTYSSRIKNNTGTIALDTNGHDVTFTYSLDNTNTGGLTKSGAGTLILSTSNDYTGATRLNGGTLLVNGSLANTAVTVNSGATLGGSGKINGPTSVAFGAHLAPGNSPGTLTFTNGLTLNDGAILDFQLGDPRVLATSDKIALSSGLLSVNGTITVNLANAGGFTAGTYTLIDATGNLTPGALSSIGATTFELGTVIAGYTYTFSQTGDSLDLIVSAIPEPATAAALLGVMALAFTLTRRRSK